jgi:putative addiction module component (TIGR02574 family)
MSSTVEALEAEALQLSAAERARLVERLIASLDADPDVEAAWAEEVERRNAEIESGAVGLVPGPEALAKLKAEFRCSTRCTPRREMTSGRQPSSTANKPAPN